MKMVPITARIRVVALANKRSSGIPNNTAKDKAIAKITFLRSI